MHQEDWTSVFSPLLLSRGKNYYASGRVSDILEDEEGYFITVHDGHDYFVSVIADGGSILGIGCSCPQAEKGERCVHMAAALYALEKRLGRIAFASGDFPGKIPAKEEKKEEEEEVLSFLADSDLDVLTDMEYDRRKQDFADRDRPMLLDYHYFNGREFTNGLNISDDLMQEARDLIRSRKIRPIEISFAYDDEEKGENLIGRACLKSPEEGFRSWQADISFDRDRILDSYCSNISCHYRYDRNSYLGRTLCRHQVAAILLSVSYIEDHNPGDTTNLQGERLLTMTAGAGAENSPAMEHVGRKDLVLEPYLNLDSNGSLAAHFRIGSGRLYKIRDIPETTDGIEKHMSQIFGSNTRIQLGREYILPEYLPWLDYLKQIVLEEKQQAALYEEKNQNKKDYTPLPGLTDSVYLYGSRLDRFFDIAMEAGSPMEIRQKSRDKITFGIRPLNLVLEIRKDEDEKHHIFHGIILEGDCPNLLYGSEGVYYLTDKEFLKIPPKDLPPLANILSAAKNGRIRIRIGRIHLAKFYYKLLPILRDAVDIIEHDHDEIMKYLPPKPEFVTFLDLDDQTVFSRCQVFYGDQMFSVTDVFDEENEKKRMENFRDREEESEVAWLLRRYLPAYSETYQILYSKKNEDRICEFLDKGLDELSRVSEIRATPAFLRLKLVKHARFQVGVNVGNNLMDLRVTSQDLSRSDLLEILGQYKKKKKYVRLKNGDYFKIDENETLESLTLLMDSLHMSPRDFVDGKMQIPAYRALYLDKMLEKSQDLYTRRNQTFTRLIRDFKTVEDAEYELPPSLRDTLRNYQVTGYRWLRTLDANGFGGILADDMGLGKTLQVITVMLADKLENMERSEELPSSSLVVCPASLVYNWYEELLRFAPQLVVKIVTGNSEAREKIIEGYKDVDVLITSYDLLRRDVLFYEEKLFRFVIADEAQYIKNPQTAAAKSIKLVRAVTRYALTGTPIENKLSELWSIFDFIMPGCLYRYSDFKEDFEIPITRKYDEEKLEILQKMVSPFILRRMKEEVLQDLPDKLEENFYTKMEGKQQALYDGQVTEILRDLSTGSDRDFSRNKLKILSQLTRLRQICCDPSLCFEDYKDGSAKRESCLELVRNLIESEHKLIIFSQFASMLELIEEDLKAEEIDSYKITGATPKARRLELVNAFNHDDTPVFLISLKAGGTGLNLTGADVVIHYDPWWNFAAQNQATDRAYRIGQKNLVTVYKLIAKGTIEEKIVKLQETKRKLADRILDTDDVSSSRLNKEDLMALLSYDPQEEKNDNEND